MADELNVSPTNTTFYPNITPSTDTEWTAPDIIVTPSYVLKAIGLTAVVIVTSFGNLIVLVAFIVDSKLWQPFNLYIMNLAVTDFLVGVSAMTFCTIDTLMGYWPFGQVMCGVWVFLDYGMTFASVFTMVVISLDRFWCVTWPVHYKNNNNTKKTIVCLLFVWLAMFVVWTPPCIADRIAHSELHYCYWDPLKNPEYVLFVATFGQCIPCLLIMVCYCKVFMVMRRQTRRTGALSTKPVPGKTSQGITAKTVSTAASSDVGKPITANQEIESISENKSHVSTLSTGDEGPSARSRSATTEPQESSQNKERRIFITLSYVLGSYLICWLPFYVVFCMSAWTPDLVPTWVFTLFYWTAYFNSTLNPFLYAYSNREFRKSFARVIRSVFFCKMKL